MSPELEPLSGRLLTASLGGSMLASTMAQEVDAAQDSPSPTATGKVKLSDISFTVNMSKPSPK